MKQIQTINCKTCKSIFAACVEPGCYTDKDWLKSLKKYVSRGDEVKLIPVGSDLKLSKCKCIK
jgi:hypothetical protein